MNWSFVNSSALWTLPIALFPILIHLFFRKPPRLADFGDLRLLKSVVRRFSPRKKISEWILLFLRIAALVCLILFLSRPVLHWGGGMAANDSSAVVLCLDASYSMGYRESGISRWERAVKLANPTLAALKDSDRAAVIVFSEDIEYNSGNLTGDIGSLAGKLDGIRPAAKTTDFLPVLQAAYSLLRTSRASNKSILLLSDLADHGFNKDLEGSRKDATALIPDYDPQVKILYTDFGEVFKNIGFKEAELGLDLYSNTLKIQAKIKNYGRDAVQAPLHIELEDGRKLSERIVALSGGEEKQISLACPLGQETRWNGKLQLGPDGLEIDNAYYFAEGSPRKLKVLCVEEPLGIAAFSGKSFYFRQALLTPPSPFDIKVEASADLKNTDLSLYDLVAFFHPQSLDSEISAPLRRFLEKGGAVLVVLGDGYQDPGGGSTPDFLPCSLYPAVDLGAAQISPQSFPESMAAFQEAYDWSKIEIAKAVRAEVRENGEPWILLTNGTPLLIASKDHRVGVWLAGLDRSWNNFPAKPVFVPLLRFLTQELAASAKPASEQRYRVGQPYRRKYAAGEEISLVSASGKTVPVKKTPLEFVSDPLEESGIYKVAGTHGAPKERKFAVNLKTDGNESDLKPADPKVLHAFLPKTQWVGLDPGDGYLANLLSSLKGKEMSRPFLGLAGIFLAAELFLAKRKK